MANIILIAFMLKSAHCTCMYNIYVCIHTHMHSSKASFYVFVRIPSVLNYN